jgi:RHS repeat-associated protein
VEADHLGTPRQARDDTGRLVWRWMPGEPFGSDEAETDPDGDGTPFDFNLRFPGQYLDRETGLHYNYFRDYDPSAGRYVQSDPIGLAGGINTYGYVGGNPLSYIDPLGLTKTRGQRINEALQEMPERWCDIWPASCYQNLRVCVEAECCDKDCEGGLTNCRPVTSWLPNAPTNPKQIPPNCRCKKWQWERE